MDSSSVAESMTTTEANNGVAGSQGDASIANLQTFLDTFVCAANANGTDYFFCEHFFSTHAFFEMRGANMREPS